MLNQIFGAALGIGQSFFNNWLSREQAEEARKQNYYYGELAAQNADARTRALYNDFYSPSALLKQYNEAGLSPSIMFGGTPGQGGMSGAQGSGASGTPTAYAPMNMIEAAQAAALFAQAEKSKAETKVVEETAHASIQEMLANAGHAKAAAAAAEAQATGQNLHNYFTSETMEGSIYKLCAEAEEAGQRAEKAYHEMRSAKVLGDINEQTYQEQVEAKRKEVELLAQKITESKSVVRLNDQERRKIYNDILGMWDDLDRRWKEQETSKQQADTYTDWINAQIPTIEKQLEIRFKELDIENTRMIVDAVTGTIKSIAFGAMAAASFAGGKGSNATPPAAAEILKKGAKGGNAIKTGVPIHKNDYTWGF